ncbi:MULTISPECIES: ImmA/IrrE family metallo-endopeptidase [Acidobacterium]|uniref:Conserved domain protein n=1 Tax=Acidobacterium capsulatum (strain ATCC 51196 / DSM 11244 / BCRC 80197 / JCM 7670 / NBRC 15755 / NCIMB 13165 / 161) TaxID=240015 RepID=C1F6N7_ACIC5|nr:MULTISPECIES: ImmA/IrrE family metallo-endopeptidase [Acidobacterium]ACO33761.1 conserved domain protein [Acidobacterium capsulatum ATCC 51196]HCT60930.1 ImmA/IrrE family metallo-endopeptidase [Acidobacterium sp.]
MAANPEWYRTPFEILNDLGITEPQDIDIEAIAEDCGATIRYLPLTGCAARIMGYKNRAIISIDENTRRPRQRFSAAHEVGHWMRDRGQLAFKCGSESFVREWSAENPETRANRFASDLLLPAKMFRAKAYKLPVTFETVRQIGDIFCTSLTATAIRLVEYGDLPAIIVCNGPRRREWFIPNGEVRGKIFLDARPGKGSIAEALLRGDRSDIAPREVRSDAWFDHRNAANYWVHEDSIPVYDGSVLSLLWWKDETQLIQIDNDIEARGAWRSDYRRDD